MKNKKNNILLIGDFFLDEFFIGNSTRMSPEAPVPIIKHLQSSFSLGGAGNVLSNLSNLKNNVFPLSILGKDKISKKIISLIKKKKINENNFIIKKSYEGILKKRILINNQHIARIDYENINDDIINNCSKLIIKKIEKLIRQCAILIISDYGKKSLNSEVIKQSIKLAKKYKVLSIVDPRKMYKDYSIYSGCDFITPNLNELRNLFPNVKNQDKDIIKACKQLKKKYFFKNIIITRGEKGVTYFSKRYVKHYYSNVKSVFDVSGAGDTVVAVLATCINLNIDVLDAVKFANLSAGHVVTLKGTQPITYKKFKEILEL